MDYIEKLPYMVIFQNNLYIFGIHLWIVLYPKPCYNEPCYKEVEVYTPNKYSEFSPCAFWIVKDAKSLHANNEDSDPTTGHEIFSIAILGSKMSRCQFLEKECAQELVDHLED